MFTLILFIIYLNYIEQKNIVLPFKKLTIEYLDEIKSISDFINFNIYTNISMGTPQKNVSHFICMSNKFFYYDKFRLQYTTNPDLDKIQKEIENSLDIFYNIHNSSTFEIINSSFNIYSDIYHFFDLQQTEKIYNLSFITYDIKENYNLTGIIDLNTQENQYGSFSKYIFRTLKQAGVIDDTYITFMYGEYDLNYNFNYLNDNYNDILGTLILGDSPHIFAPDKYKEEDEIKVNGRYILDIKEIKFISHSFNFSEINKFVSLKFNSEFIKGTLQYRNIIESVFFNELIKANICRTDYIEKNLNEKLYIYSCKNDTLTREKLKSFPTLYFEMKDYNLVFLFNYNELFKVHNDTIYFLIYFDGNTYSNWEMGEIFLRKYITSFNYYSKTISFYKTQIDEINKKTDIRFNNEEPVEKPTKENHESKTKTLIIIIIVGAIAVFVVVISLVLSVVIRKKLKKKKAYELNDDYDYTPSSKIIN